MANTRPSTKSSARALRSSDGARNRLLGAADELFYRRGIRNVGIDEIIAKAGVAKASLYNHFASKDDLILAYVQRRDEEWWSWFREQVENRASTPSKRLLAVFDVLAEFVAQSTFRGCAFQNTSIELADRAHPAHRAVVASKRAMRSYLAQLADEAGLERPKALAEQLGLLVDGALITASLEGTDAPARTARTVAATLLKSA
jgi:AcrR family transcriptional regulator